MGHREFIVPADQSFVDHIGVAPDRTPGGDEVASITLDTPAGENVCFSYDVPNGSIALRVSRGTETLLSLYREGATLLSLEPRDSGCVLHVDFARADCVGKLNIETSPQFKMSDQLLWT
ncbi:hypothetical protein [Actinorugispora endophytica]|uniref:Uncharacterized protein n=1 Tax=Actinorugispora endophytica TaxID=1605990 RepID=A0A4R6UXQ0_9ACTN|nr:hypothetical protein [Actinorugispora endophytica]TDQ52201.1 hypothetical protein EV190_10731 [Actinorugispora endophytica]